jgi:hypothetical protein
MVGVGFGDGIEAETASSSPRIMILIGVFEGVKSAALKHVYQP